METGMIWHSAPDVRSHELCDLADGLFVLPEMPLVHF